MGTFAKAMASYNDSHPSHGAVVPISDGGRSRRLQMRRKYFVFRVVLEFVSWQTADKLSLLIDDGADALGSAPGVEPESSTESKEVGREFRLGEPHEVRPANSQLDCTRRFGRDGHSYETHCSGFGSFATSDREGAAFFRPSGG